MSDKKKIPDLVVVVIVCAAALLIILWLAKTQAAAANGTRSISCCPCGLPKGGAYDIPLPNAPLGDMPLGVPVTDRTRIPIHG